MPLLSIVIPIYNTPKKLLFQCVESILKQSFNDFELLLVDDGSQEEVAKVIDTFAEKDKRILTFHQVNCGVSSARNMGIQKACGKYLMFVDADDVLASHALAMGVEIAEKQGADIVIGLTQCLSFANWKNLEIDGNKERILQPNIDLEIIEQPESYQKLISQLLTVDNYWFSYEVGFLNSGPVAKIYNCDLIKQIRFKEYIHIGEDTIWLLEILAQTKKVYIVNQLWYYYINNNDSATHKYRPNRIIEFLNEVEEYSKVVNELWPQNLSDLYIKLYILLKLVFEQYIFNVNNKSMAQEKYRSFKTVIDAPVMKEMIRSVNFTVHKKSIKNIVKQLSLKTALYSKRLSFGIHAVLFAIIK